MKWELVALEQLVDLADPGVWGPEDVECGVRILRSTNFRDDGSLDLGRTAFRSVPPVKRRQKTLESGDIILERSGGGPSQPVGRVCYFDGAEEPHLFGNFCQRLRPNPKLLEPRFLFWHLYYLHRSGGTRAYQRQTTGIRNLDFHGYLRHPVPLPQPSEQRRIVGILDQANRLCQLRSEAEEKAERLLPVLLTRILGRPETWPSDSDCKPLGSLASFVSGATPPKSVEAFWQGGVPWVSPKDMKTDFLSDSQDHVSEAAVQEANLRLIERGTTLLVVRGMILARTIPLAMNLTPVTINQDMKALLPKRESITGTYLWAALTVARQQLRSLVRTAGHGTRKLDTPDLMQFRVPLPTPDQTQKVSSVVETHRHLVESREKGALATNRLFRLLLSRAFSGSLTSAWRESEGAEVLEENSRNDSCSDHMEGVA